MGFRWHETLKSQRRSIRRLTQLYQGRKDYPSARAASIMAGNAITSRIALSAHHHLQGAARNPVRESDSDELELLAFNKFEKLGV